MHEELPEFKLVNMNARLYDAVLGRFIQPDNEIQDPDNLQNINRYSYVLNNPLKYFDPSGNEYEGYDSYLLGHGESFNLWETDEGSNGYVSFDQSEGYGIEDIYYLYAVDVFATKINIEDAETSYSEEQELNATIEQVLRFIMTMKEGSELTGEQISKFNPRFSKVGTVVSNVTKTKTGIQVNLTTSGKALIKFTSEYGSVHGSMFTLTNYTSKDGVQAVHVQSNTATYGDKLVNFYIDDNKMSLSGRFYTEMFKK